MLAVDIKYSVHDLLCDVINNAWPAKLQMISTLPLSSARLSKLWIPFLNYLFDKELYKKFLWFPYFSLFLAFNHDFIMYMDFIRIVASNTATDNLTN